ncbi:MAG: hypothetical protein RBG13Loki_1309 [Promethearchaeota archaeon CR_4]|nr:MAG: hypothetical protein RBG13Loki_1309 [Candidatus Lokiarchaeota archaeon CR_4]
MIVETQVGSKGELFLSKQIRDSLGLKPGDRIYLEVTEGKIIVRKVPDLIELLKMPRIGKSETPEEIERDIEEMNRFQYETSSDDSD